MREALTSNEQAVLGYMVHGYDNICISRALSISRYTVKVYVSCVLKKLHAANRTHAAYIALRDNLVDV